MSWESQLCCSTRNHTAMIHNSIRQGILHPYCHSHLAAPMTRNFWFGTQPKFQRCFWFHLCQSTMPMSYRCVSVSSVSDQICACCAVGRGRGKPDLVSRITSMATFREAWPIGNWVCFQNLWVHRLCVHAHEDAEKQQAHFLHSYSEMWYLGSLFPGVVNFGPHWFLLQLPIQFTKRLKWENQSNGWGDLYIVWGVGLGM